MLPKSDRLKRKDFKELKNTKRVHGTFFFGVHTPPIPGSKGLVAVIISKKVAPKAADRHLLKRRVMHALRSLTPRPYSLTITAKTGSNSLSYSAILNELKALLASIH
jgi:ribonuclease P protein component